jgi:hypothetical protein
MKCGYIGLMCRPVSIWKMDLSVKDEICLSEDKPERLGQLSLCSIFEIAKMQIRLTLSKGLTPNLNLCC